MIKKQHKIFIFETEHNILADRFGKPQYETMKTKWMKIVEYGDVWGRDVYSSSFTKWKWYFPS